MAFFPLEDKSQVQDGYQRAFEVADLKLVLLQVEGERYLIENRCPHMDVPLAEAVQLPGRSIRCRAHGIEFSLETGKASGPLANQLDCLKKYPLTEQGDMLGIDIE